MVEVLIVLLIPIYSIAASVGASAIINDDLAILITATTQRPSFCYQRVENKLVPNGGGGGGGG